MDFSAQAIKTITQTVRKGLWLICDTNKNEIYKNAITSVACFALTGLIGQWPPNFDDGVSDPELFSSTTFISGLIFGTYASMQLSGKVIKESLLYLFPQTLSLPFARRVRELSIEEKITLAAAVGAIGAYIMSVPMAMDNWMSRSTISYVSIGGLGMVLSAGIYLVRAAATDWNLERTGALEPQLPVQLPPNHINQQQNNLINSINQLRNSINNEPQLQNNIITNQLNIITNQATQILTDLSNARNQWQVAVGARNQALSEKDTVELEKRLLEADIEKLSVSHKRQPPHEELYESICECLGLLDPILQTPLCFPVTTKDGHTYERSSIQECLKKTATDPLSKSPLNEKDLVTNKDLQRVLRLIDSVTHIISFKKADLEDLKNEVIRSLPGLPDSKEASIAISGVQVPNRAYNNLQDSLRKLLAQQTSDESINIIPRASQNNNNNGQSVRQALKPPQ